MGTQQTVKKLALRCLLIVLETSINDVNDTVHQHSDRTSVIVNKELLILQYK